MEASRNSNRGGSNNGARDASFSQTTFHRGNVAVRYQQSNTPRDLKSFQFLSHNQQCRDQAGEWKCALLKRRGMCTTHLATKEVECRKTCGLCWDKEQKT